MRSSRMIEQDDEVIQYTSEVSDIIESQYKIYYRSDIDFWDGGAPPTHTQTPRLWRGHSLYAFNHDIYAQKP